MERATVLYEAIDRRRQEATSRRHSTTLSKMLELRMSALSDTCAVSSRMIRIDIKPTRAVNLLSAHCSSTARADQHIGEEAELRDSLSQPSDST